jgi:diguanylate cyclase (GGDEF)-like protein
VQETARLDDLRAVRQAVMGCATEMKSCVKKMADEGARSISSLKSEIETYREKLEDYQRRDSTDPLTGLASRPAVEARIQDRMIWKADFCLAVLDMNGFKKINDTHGHAAGDQLLQQFAAELRPLIRSTDIVGRWGGDEFVIVMDATKEEAQRMIDRVCAWAFGEYELNDNHGLVREQISAAVGIAQWDGTETSLDLFKRADQLMYADKQTTPISQGRPGKRGFPAAKVI